MLNLTTNILLLSKSIRIKFNILAKYINNQIEKTYGIVPSDDPTEWKYYLNLCGMKHVTNNDVKIKIIETDEIVSLTKEVLITYKYTRKELLKNSSLYIELINNYPEDIDYIIGCLYPTDMETILNSVDGTILTYNKEFVEDNENLIFQLEHYIKNVLSRWHIDAYAVVEDLYLPSLLSVLYGSIPGKILNIRLNNIKTSRVHSYFLQEFFNSRMLLWTDVKYLNKESIFWLYHNLDYLIKHVGKTKTLTSIVNNVFEINNVGIGSYQLHQTTPNIDVSKSLSELPYDVNRSKIVTKALNNSYVVNDDEEISIEDITELQLLETDPLKGLLDNQLEKTEYISKNILDMLTTKNKGIENTKILDIHIKDLFKINSDSLLDIVVNNLIHLVSENKYNGLIDYNDPNSGTNSDKPRIGSIIEYTEPNNSQTYTLTPFSGVLMLVALLLKLAKRDDQPLTYINYYDVIDDNLGLDSHLANIFPDGYSEKILSTLNNILPTKVETIQTPYDMSLYISEIIYFSKLSWILDSNCENNIVSANIKQYLERITKNGKLVLSETPKTVKELLSEQGIVYDIKNSFDIVASIRELLYAFTNIKVDEYEELRLSLNAYKNILNKLTSYTTQIIDTVDSVDNKAMVYNNNPSALYSKLGLLTILDARLYPLEDFIGVLNAELNDFRDNTSHGFFNTTKPRAFLRDIEMIRGNIHIYNDKFIRDDKPTNYIDLLEIPNYDILHEEFKDVFFKDVQSINYPLEDFEGNNSFELNDMRDEPTGSLNPEIASYPFVRTEDIIRGKTYITTGSGVILDKPNTTIDLIDIPDYDITKDEFKDTFFKDVISVNNPLETIDITTKSGANDMNNDLTGGLNTHTSSISHLKNENDISGIGLVTSGSGVLYDSPSTYIDLQDKPTYDISLEEFKDIFFTNVTTDLGIDVLDGTAIDLSTGSIILAENEPIANTAITNDTTVIEEPTVSGSGQVYTSFVDTDEPTNTIIVEEIE